LPLVFAFQQPINLLNDLYDFIFTAVIEFPVEYVMLGLVPAQSPGRASSVLSGVG